jgi:hypothetical protein
MSENVIKPGDRLSNEEMSKISSTVISSFDTELDRLLTNDDTVRVSEFFTQMYYSVDLYTFFVAVRLKKTTEDIFDNDHIRKFVFNLVDRVNVSLPGNDLCLDERFIKTLASAIVKSRVKGLDNQVSLINKEVLATLYIDESTLITLLKDNQWLAILYFMLVNFNKTVLFAALSQSK